LGRPSFAQELVSRQPRIADRYSKARVWKENLHLLNMLE
jgi:hypothetical protein